MGEGRKKRERQTAGSGFRETEKKEKEENNNNLIIIKERDEKTHGRKKKKKKKGGVVFVHSVTRFREKREGERIGAARLFFYLFHRQRARL